MSGDCDICGSYDHVEDFHLKGKTLNLSKGDKGITVGRVEFGQPHYVDWKYAEYVVAKTQSSPLRNTPETLKAMGDAWLNHYRSLVVNRAEK